ncbi:hypothetical protein [Cysteiniphilum halobium]|uniref:hypothetical protein n=1 Tax=Cysteiniphilum halobium TaxID=2219059 RepID=UPI000E655E67|nr:hypothetical protein [Cysteiniphilum halobium]
MMRKTIIFLSGILLALVSIGGSLPPQQVQFNLTLDTSTMPTIEVDLSNQHIGMGLLKLDKDQKLPAFKSAELQGQVLLTNSNALEVSITCENQKDGACFLHAVDRGGACPACKVAYKVCLLIDHNNPFCNASVLNNQTITVAQNKMMPFRVYVYGDGGDEITLRSKNEKFIGNFLLTFKASFI